jgi:hypothetical protein
MVLLLMEQKACKLMGLKLIDIDDLQGFNDKYKVILDKYQKWYMFKEVSEQWVLSVNVHVVYWGRRISV